LQFLACECKYEGTFETVNNFKGKLVGTLGAGQLANEFPGLAPCYYAPEISTTLNALLSSLFFLAKLSELAESIFKMAKNMCLLCFLVDKLLQAFFGNIARFFYWVFIM
jgi:hypothetical protein